ncbi:[FeFe] hydrogenase H-cluster radical SAM maturase HydE [Candidatus Fermentibacteria bacterium]|nr:[FeFe] hydrogenase H-cluster radical SAM maturase HydE [Candidatus Fermentibacteria bacterium]
MEERAAEKRPSGGSADRSGHACLSGGRVVSSLDRKAARYGGRVEPATAKGLSMIDEEWLDRRISRGFDRADLRRILTCDHSEAEAVFEAARRLREEVFGRKAFIRAVVEFDNSCHCNCLYCGMRRENTETVRFKLNADQILSVARRAHENGIRTFFLQSAESDDYGAGWLADVITRIRELGMGVILCVGIHEAGALDLWYEAGARKFILKHETADGELFAKMKPGATLENRLSWLRTLREKGFDIGSGTLLGLPGQTIDSLVSDLVLMKELEVDMSSVALFLPARGTPLQDQPSGDVDLGLRFVAALRLYLGDPLIPATSTFERLREGGQLGCFQAGANVITVNMTPPGLRDDYQLYTDRFYVGLRHARRTIERAGLEETTESDLLG